MSAQVGKHRKPPMDHPMNLISDNHSNSLDEPTACDASTQIEESLSQTETALARENIVSLVKQVRWSSNLWS